MLRSETISQNEILINELVEQAKIRFFADNDLTPNISLALTCMGWGTTKLHHKLLDFNARYNNPYPTERAYLQFITSEDNSPDNKFGLLQNAVGLIVIGAISHQVESTLAEPLRSWSDAELKRTYYNAIAELPLPQIPKNPPIDLHHLESTARIQQIVEADPGRTFTNLYDVTTLRPPIIDVLLTRYARYGFREQIISASLLFGEASKRLGTTRYLRHPADSDPTRYPGLLTPIPKVFKT